MLNPLHPVFWSGAQYAGVYLARVDLPQYFTSGSTFFFDSFITTEGSDADTSIRAA